MSDEKTEHNEQVESDEQPENTPAGSYRVAGNDTSAYLGVDPEYMNYADETQKPSLTDEEAYLFLPAPEDEDHDATPGEEETESESLELSDKDAEEHGDSEEKATYDSPVADHPTGESTDETPSGDAKSMAPKRPSL